MDHGYKTERKSESESLSALLGRIATIDRNGVVCMSVCLLVTFMSRGKTVEPIDIPTGGYRLGAFVTV